VETFQSPGASSVVVVALILLSSVVAIPIDYTNPRTCQVAYRYYTPEEIQEGLQAYIWAGENATQASRNLAAKGKRIARTTLIEWSKTHADMIEDLKAKHEEYLTDLYRDVARKSAEATIEGVELALSDIREGKVKDPGATVRNLATTAGIATDKIMLLTGRPTDITEHRDPAQVIKELANLLGHKNSVESTAVEINSKELEE
jgi:hypothetical protein